MADLRIQVALLSGRNVAVEASSDEPLSALKQRALDALGIRKGRLLSGATILNEDVPIKKARIGDGGLTLHVATVRLSSAGRAFAAILGDSTVMT